MTHLDERARQNEGSDYLDKVPVRSGPDWPVIIALIILPMMFWIVVGIFIGAALS